MPILTWSPAEREIELKIKMKERRGGKESLGVVTWQQTHVGLLHVWRRVESWAKCGPECEEMITLTGKEGRTNTHPFLKH